MNNEVEVLNLMKTGSFWLPKSISNFGSDVDALFYFILGCSVVFFVGIMAVTAYFLYHFQASKRNSYLDKKTKELTHNNTLEVIWTVLPLILVMFIFAWGYKGYLKMAVSPENAIQIRITGQKWQWEFVHVKTGQNEAGQGAKLVVPADYPVKLVMSSKDVLHSFFVPNLRIKRDTLPNRYTTMWFVANEEGEYPIFCAEYCGDQHSEMGAILKVVSMDEYQEYIKYSGDGDLPPVEVGQKYYNRLCKACHSVDGTSGVGPTWKGLYGKKRDFTNAPSEIVDDNYIRESMVYPMKKKVVGYQAVMNSYAGEDDYVINGIIEYIKTLKENE